MTAASDALPADALAALSPWWHQRRVLVTGGAGNLGSHLVEWLAAAGARVLVADDLSTGRRAHLTAVPTVPLFTGDLRERAFAETCCAEQEVVMHVAGVAPGLQAGDVDHAALCEANTLLGASVLAAARTCGVRRVLVVSSSCVYPDDAPVPTPELPVGFGEPERANRGYGWGKRHLERLAAEARADGLEVALARPFNLYGPRDLWGGRGGHVLPTLLARLLGPDGELVLWGSGRQTRSLLHARDAAWQLAWLAAHHATGEAINVGSGEEHTIEDLARALMRALGREKPLRADLTKPEGANRKACDDRRLRALLAAHGHHAPATPFAQGLAEVVAARRALDVGASLRSAA